MRLLDIVKYPGKKSTGSNELTDKLFFFLSFTVQERFCKFVGKEIDKRSHEECRDYSACSDDCANAGNRSSGEEVESYSQGHADAVRNYPYILEFAYVPCVGDYQCDCVVC